MHNVISVTVFITVFLIGAAHAENLVYSGKPPEFDKYGYAVDGAKWVFEEGKGSVIHVCWENPSSENETERSWVKEQIQATWERHSALEFRGWIKCAETNSGIRIHINDEGARVLKFGKLIDGIDRGMVLNFTFQRWNQGCQEFREECIRSIAVHEFGHAIGFAHEQNRPDTPGECSLLHGQGQTEEKMLTPYDPDSVMNYCNPKYNNDGKLSDLDKKAVQSLYGKPQDKK